jgi:hypothetical protein
VRGSTVHVALDSSLPNQREPLKVWTSKVSERIGSSPTHFDSGIVENLGTREVFILHDQPEGD